MTGINDDRYKVWRQGEQSEIGHVHLAFKIIIQALYDFFHGNPEEMVSAALFFFGSQEQSTYSLWCRVLGEKGAIVLDCLNDYTSTGKIPPVEMFSELDKLYNNL